MGVFVAIGLNEWMRIIGFAKNPFNTQYFILVILLLFATIGLMQHPWAIGLLLIASVIWWTIQLLDLSSYHGETGYHQNDLLKNLWTGIFLLVPTWASLVYLHQQPDHGPGLVLYLLVLIWTADSGAYFVGRARGKNKLAPLISPGKTREGAYGAFAASGVVTIIGAIWLELSFMQFVFFILLNCLVVVYSIAGDLLESVYKRKAQIKDSGTLLPGHGGVLDRIDSLMSASPLFTLGLWVIGIIK